HIIFLFALSNGISVVAQEWRASFKQGQEAFGNGNYQEALKHFRDAQSLAPEGVNITDLINQSAYRSGSFKDAVKGYEEATENATSKTDKSTANYNLGNAYFKDKQTDKAIEAYKEALRQDPNNEKARYNLAYALRQQQQENENKDQNNDQNQDNQNDENQDSGDQNENQDQQDNQNNNENKDDSSSE